MPEPEKMVDMFNNIEKYVNLFFVIPMFAFFSKFIYDPSQINLLFLILIVASNIYVIIWSKFVINYVLTRLKYQFCKDLTGQNFLTFSKNLTNSIPFGNKRILYLTSFISIISYFYTFILLYQLIGFNQILFTGLFFIQITFLYAVLLQVYFSKKTIGIYMKQKLIMKPKS